MKHYDNRTVIKILRIALAKIMYFYTNYIRRNDFTNFFLPKYRSCNFSIVTLIFIFHIFIDNSILANIIRTSK